MKCEVLSAKRPERGCEQASWSLGVAADAGVSIVGRLVCAGYFLWRTGYAVRVLRFTAACPGSTLTMVRLSHFIILSCVLPLQWLRAADLSRATLTEVVADVTIIDPGSKAISPARVNDAFTAPPLLRTGHSSRVEMIAEDQTLTRIGANSLFSFVPGQRHINLQRGSVLFNSPAGRGGGTIKTACARCSVLGTTLIVVATEEGGLKVLLLEGRGKVTNAKGDTLHLNAGQMICLLPGQPFGPPINFRIPDQVRSSKLVSGFHTSLKSLPKIEAASRNQDRQMARGEMRPANSGDPGEQGPPGQDGPPPAGGPPAAASAR